MIEYSLSEQTEIPSGGEFSVKVIGVGGAGANVLDRMALEGSDEADLLTLNTDVRALSTSVSTNKLQLGTTLLKGMGAGGDPELGRQAALEAIDDIRETVRGYKMAFVCVGLGGGTGSGAAPEVCRVAKEEGVFLVVFATLPFSFEGKRRMDQALEALDRIGDYSNAVVTFENDRMGELIVPKDGVQQAFAAADKIISQSIRATTGIVSHPGIIRIGMDELLSALDTKKSRCLFGFGQAKGDNRAHEALEQALKSPLLDKGKLLEDAKNVLIHVGGGDGMTLFEVELVMQELAKHIDENRTQILFGTGTDKSLGSSLTVTVISSLDGPGGEPRPPRPSRSEKDQDDSDSGFAPPQSTSPLAGAVEALEGDEGGGGETDSDPGGGAPAESVTAEEIEEEEVTAEVEEEEPPAVEEIIEEEEVEETEAPVAEEEVAEEEAVEAEGEESAGETVAVEEAEEPVAEEESEVLEAEAEEEEPEAIEEDAPEAEEAAVEEIVEEEPEAVEEEAAESESESEPVSEVDSDSVAEEDAETEEGEPEAEEEQAPEDVKPVEPEVIPRKVVQSIPKRKPVIEVPKKRPNRLNIAPVPPKASPADIAAESGAWGDLESPDSIGNLLQQGKKANEAEPEAQAEPEIETSGEPEVDVEAETVPISSISEPESPPEEAAASEMEEEEMIVAETEDAQKITLSRLVPGGGAKTPKPEPVEEVEPVSPIDGGGIPLDLAGDQGGLEIDAVTAQQQQMLQLEPLSKGRFAKTEPTIVDGEDMDVPTFLRKRRK